MIFSDIYAMNANKNSFHLLNACLLKIILDEFTQFQRNNYNFIEIGDTIILASTGFTISEETDGKMQ